jgi:hypothetical protein
LTIHIALLIPLPSIAFLVFSYRLLRPRHRVISTLEHAQITSAAPFSSCPCTSPPSSVSTHLASLTRSQIHAPIAPPSRSTAPVSLPLRSSYPRHYAASPPHAFSVSAILPNRIIIQANPRPSSFPPSSTVRSHLGGPPLRDRRGSRQCSNIFSIVHIRCFRIVHRDPARDRTG